MDGKGGKRSSGGDPFSFLKRSKSKASSAGSRVSGSGSVPAALDSDEGLQADVSAERIVYELDVDGDVVAKVGYNDCLSLWWFCLKEVKKGREGFLWCVYSCSWGHISVLRNVTCHMRSRSFFCHSSLHVNMPRLNPP